jgi:membrane protein DedA with SNARE-associated domain
VATWIEGVVQSTGVFGIAFLMLLENIFPPIPSELIMPLAGYSAARGQANIVLIIIAARWVRSPALISGTWWACGSARSG